MTNSYALSSALHVSCGGSIGSANAEIDQQSQVSPNSVSVIGKARTDMNYSGNAFGGANAVASSYTYVRFSVREPVRYTLIGSANATGTENGNIGSVQFWQCDPNLRNCSTVVEVINGGVSQSGTLSNGLYVIQIGGQASGSTTSGAVSALTEFSYELKFGDVQPPTDFFAIELINNSVASAWLAAYTVQGGPRSTDTIAGVFWAKGTNFSDRLSNTPFYSNNIAATFSGPDSFFIPDHFRTNAPWDTTHLLLVLDPFNEVSETIETNNVIALPFYPLGIDISKSAGELGVSDCLKIKGQGYQFVIVAGKQSVTLNEHASVQLHNARMAGLQTATYCFLNFTTKSDGARQIRDTLLACTDEAKYLGFIAIDVERPKSATTPLNPAEKAMAVLRISEAVDQVNAVGLRPIMYTRRDDWIYYTDDSNLFRNLLLWNPRTKNGSDITIPDLSLSSETFGGWTNRSGKQYEISTPESPYYLNDPHIEVDLDVFHPAAFSLSNPDYKPIDFTVSAARFGDQLKISWFGPFFTLEEAPSVDGPWISSPNQTSPVFVVPSGSGKLYRVR